jgi:hypothetical protein
MLRLDRITVDAIHVQVQWRDCQVPSSATSWLSDARVPSLGHNSLSVLGSEIPSQNVPWTYSAVLTPCSDSCTITSTVIASRSEASRKQHLDASNQNLGLASPSRTQIQGRATTSTLHSSKLWWDCRYEPTRPGKASFDSRKSNSRTRGQRLQ